MGAMSRVGACEDGMLYRLLFYKLHIVVGCTNWEITSIDHSTIPMLQKKNESRDQSGG